jgi:predicted RNA-binding Zn ribbon-like protein
MSATTTTSTPAEVALVRSFVNTLDVDEGIDELETPVALAAWLRKAGLVTSGTPASGRDLKLALRLRAALRDELIGHHDQTLDRAAAAALDEVCAELPLKAVCSSEVLAPSAGGIRGALAQIVAATAQSRIKGTWDRLKLCPADDCLWAFYDSSRNRSKRWCSMEVCGNRNKVRAYRDRSHL